MPINESVLTEFSKLKDALDNFSRGNYSNEHTSRIVVERCTNILQQVNKKKMQELFLEDSKGIKKRKLVVPNLKKG